MIIDYCKVLYVNPVAISVNILIPISHNCVTFLSSKHHLILPQLVHILEAPPTIILMVIKIITLE